MLHVEESEKEYSPNCCEKTLACRISASRGSEMQNVLYK